MSDPLLLPDVAIDKILSHLGLVDKLNLSLVNKASQWYFNASTSRPEALWGTLHLIAHAAGHDVQDDTIKGPNNRIRIEGKQLLEWLCARQRGASFRALRTDWGTPGEQYLNLHYRMPGYIAALPKLETLRINAHANSPSIEAMLLHASSRCTALTQIQFQIGDTLMIMPEMEPVWRSFAPRCCLSMAATMLCQSTGDIASAFSCIAGSLRCLSLGPMRWENMDVFELWLALPRLSELQSLQVVVLTDPRMGMLPHLRASALRNMPTRAIPKLRVARLRGLSITMPNALAACANATHIELTPCRLEAADLQYLLPVEGVGAAQRDANTALRVLVLKAVVVYSPAMWNWLAQCTGLRTLSIWFDSDCKFEDRAASAMAPQAALQQLQLVNLPAEHLPTLPPMPALTALHVAPIAREYNHVLRPWLESYTALRTLRCTCMPQRRLHEPPPDALGEEYPPVLQLPALRNLELFAVPTEMVEHLSNLRQLTSLTVSTSRVCVLPRAWSALTALRSLTTCKIRTDAFPNAALSRLTALTSLSMEYCKTKIFANSITAMTALQHLSMRDCRLVRGWPSQLSHMTGLTSLSLQAQRVDNLPQDFDETHVLSTLKALPNLRLFEHLSAREGTWPNASAKVCGRRLNQVMPRVAAQLHQRGVATRVFGLLNRVDLPEMDTRDYEEADLEMHAVPDVETVEVDKAVGVVEGAAWLDETGLREQLKLVSFAKRMLHDLSFIDINQMFQMGLVFGDDL